MRVLHLTPFYEPAWAYGGMARASAGLCRALARRGHDVGVATSHLDRDVAREEETGGVRVRRFPVLFQRWLLPWPKGFRAFLERELASVDLVHIHGHRNGFAALAARVLSPAGVPWVLTTHGTYPHHGQRRLAKLLYDRLAGDHVLAGARALLALSRAEAGDLPRPARVVGSGVEPCGSASRTRARRGGLLLFIGTDRPQKRGHVLPRLLAALPEARLRLVGRFGRRFLARLQSFGDRAEVAGVLSGDALAAAYAEADLLVHPAVGEAFGLVPFEAALLGTAAVVAGGHGCGEYFARAGGCVVPPDDVPALARAVQARLADPEAAQQEAQAVAEFARRELTWDRVAEAVERVYGEALAAGRAGAA